MLDLQLLHDIPSGSGFAHYYLIFVADANNSITETNESNNKESYLFKIDEKSSGGRLEGPLLRDSALDNSFSISESQAYPNPSTGSTILKVTNPSVPNNFIIIDSNGNLIQQITLQRGEGNIEINDLASGTYYVKSLDNNKVIRLFVK
ncbi:MAG: T9SS type A sorting domain-containing protein [Cyclobacteriaceae bacterium]